MPTTGPVASEYALLLAALGQDLATLRTIQSVERKIEGRDDRALSRGLAGALADPPVQDDIVGTMLVWAIDIADWPLALELGDHVLAARLALPERYKRRRPAGRGSGRKRAARGHGVRALEETLALTADHDMPDQVRAKLHKAIGLAFQAEAEAFDPEAESQRAGASARSMPRSPISRALELDGSAGVKKAVERLNADLKKLPEASARPDTAPFHPRRGRNGRGSIRSPPAPSPPPLFGHPLSCLKEPP
jgi:hypothetical protein